MKIKNIKVILILSIIMMCLSSIISVFAVSAYLYDSNEVSYNNNASGIEATDVQGAIDELYEHATDYAQIRAMIYPVGSIYLSVTDDTVEKVQERFGGTWESFGQGRTLVGVDTSDTAFDNIQETGGAKSQSYTPAGKNTGGVVKSHTLTISEIPSHHHAQYVTANTGGSATRSDYVKDLSKANAYAQGVNTGNTGGGGGHSHEFTNPTFTGTAATISHLQPYITVYMYKRTA